MPSPKEVLFKHGLIEKIGRGRLSADNRKWLDEFVAGGGKVDGWSVTETGETKVEKVGRVITPDVTETHPEKENEAYYFLNGKPITVSMRTVCNVCHNSLSYHFCQEPKVWVDYQTEAVVYFRKRVNPLPGKRW